MTTALSNAAAPTEAAPRPSRVVMRPPRMGASFPTRLSFLPTLIRRAAAERARVERALWRIDGEGRGEAVYTITLGGDVYSLVAFSSPLTPEERTDRVIAEAWDATFALYDGVLEAEAIDRLRANAPRQEAGRFTERELVLSRANRSERLFGHVVESLASGRQPDPARLDAVGYLMRTTAVYGNGKFGIADRAVIADRAALAGPFQAEMLTVWLIRGFTLDLAEHLAAARAPETAAPLDRASRRRIGVGNATGLGMAPFLVNHPELVGNWVAAKETALARMRARPTISAEEAEAAVRLLRRAQEHVAGWRVADVEQSRRIETLDRELASAEIAFEAAMSADHPWDRLIAASAAWSLEAQELLVSIVIDAPGGDNDALCEAMSATENAVLDPSMSVGALMALIDARYGWIDDCDLERPPRFFWYVSEEKLEPRLGEHGVDIGADRATPLDIGRRVLSLRRALEEAASEDAMARFLLRRPEHRDAVRRVQTLQRHPYAEIEADLAGADCRPVDLLRFKLAFFGASHFDPKSDRWTRVTLARGAPDFEDVSAGLGGDWSPIFGSESLRTMSA